MRLLTIILLSSYLFAGCGRKIIATKTVVKDSISYVEQVVQKDSIIYIPGTSVTVEVPVPCPDVTVFKKDSSKGAGPKTRVSLSISKGIATANCDTDSLLARISWLERHSASFKQQSQQQIITVPGDKVYLPYIPKWIWYCIALSVALNAFAYRKEIITGVKFLIGKWS